MIDPLRTITADAADEFIQPLPGTDIALMLAMMHVLIRDDLADDEWVARAHRRASTTRRACRRVDTGTGGRDRAASTPTSSSGSRRDYGTIRPAAIRTLIGAEHHTNGAMFFRTLAVLPALVGAWRDVGGGLSRSVGTYQDDGVSTRTRSCVPTSSPAASHDGST